MVQDFTVARCRALQRSWDVGFSLAVQVAGFWVQTYQNTVAMATGYSCTCTVRLYSMISRFCMYTYKQSLWLREYEREPDKQYKQKKAVWVSCDGYWLQLYMYWRPYSMFSRFCMDNNLCGWENVRENLTNSTNRLYEFEFVRLPTRIYLAL